MPDNETCDVELWRHPYPFPIDPDGCATCVRCAGEGTVGEWDTSQDCPTCKGAGYLTREEISAWIARLTDNENYQELQRRIAAYQPAPYNPEEDPF